MKCLRSLRYTNGYDTQVRYKWTLLFLKLSGNQWSGGFHDPSAVFKPVWKGTINYIKKVLALFVGQKGVWSFI